jgi:hypothetical protein
MRGARLGLLRGSGGSSVLTARTSIRPMVTRTIGSGASRLTRAGNDGLTARLASDATRVGRGEGVVTLDLSAGISAGSGGGAARSTGTPFSATACAFVGLSPGGADRVRARAAGGSAANARTGGASASATAEGVGLRT